MPPRRRAGLSSSGLTGAGLDTVIPGGTTAATPDEAAAAATDASEGQPDTAVASGRKEKIAAYVPSGLAETVRDAVAALGSHADDPRSLSELLESALRREVDRLQRERNGGKAFPRRARRQLVVGRRPD